MELAPKCDLIYGLQQVTGKILMSKNLEGEILITQAQNGTTRSLRAVTASTMIAQLDARRKVRCHKGAVENVGLEWAEIKILN